MKIRLTQRQHGSRGSCSLVFSVGDRYEHLEDIGRALAEGMTPVFTYSDGDMAWMDGVGADGLGSCEAYQVPDCTLTSAKFSNLRIEDSLPETPSIRTETALSSGEWAFVILGECAACSSCSFR